MTSKLDEELERLSKAATQEECPCCGAPCETTTRPAWDHHWTDEYGQPQRTHHHALTAYKYRTGQLILAQPSGDVVEAVALAILNSDRGMRGLDPLESRENVPDSDGYVTNATAAITTYEAVSGVAKMRDALRAFAFVGEDCPKGTQAVWEMIYRDRVQDWFSYEDFEAARAALGEKP